MHDGSPGGCDGRVGTGSVSSIPGVSAVRSWQRTRLGRLVPSSGVVVMSYPAGAFAECQQGIECAMQGILDGLKFATRCYVEVYANGQKPACSPGRPGRYIIPIMEEEFRNCKEGIFCDASDGRYTRAWHDPSLPFAFDSDGAAMPLTRRDFRNAERRSSCIIFD